jgi:CRISPR-associated protein Csx3
MSTIQLKIIPHQTADGLAYQHLRIQLTSPDGIIEPEDLKGLKLPEDITPSQGVVIEGKGPIWLYGYLVHECHATAWVGCYDPRLEGAVVVEAHTRTVSVGSVLKLTLPK